MVSRKQFYTIFSIFIIIFISAVLIFNSKDEEITGNNLIYKDNIIYTAEGKKYNGKIIESEGLKAKINGQQIAKGYIKVKNGLLDGKFDFISSGGIWSGETVNGNSKNGKIEKMEIKKLDGKLVKLSGEEKIREFFSENYKGSVSSESADLSGLEVVEENE